MKLENITIEEAVEIAGGNKKLYEEKFDKFRQWLKQQVHLPQDISDNRLRITLLTSKLNLEKAKKRLDSQYTLRTLLPEFFTNYDPQNDNIALVHKCLQWVILPKLTPEKYRITFFRFISEDASIFHLADLMKYTCMLTDVRIDIEEDMVNSDILIADFAYFTFNHLLKYIPSLVRKIDLCTEAYGLRYKGIYIINAPSYIGRFLQLIKTFMSPKIYERVKVFESGIESICEMISKSNLPADYGGEEPSLEALADMWHAKLLERREWLLEQEKVKSNESLRTDHVINADELFGVNGTFRKLEID
ncbi:retinol-binding protein pinta isoform X1 [Harpegnathos saltator]|uniref:retinol-binding protein pinta isoform X1 n=1 Tax=Harpegnathos saltator TaxID=610380 RepID=UPI000DBEE6B9|nr:retinol-binding protein pinta isoform X1 [Harpegnathos saltator]XP_025155149.1 retinol-binding protein pinta isoform X1 [Harpegnathos saltator]XP_025155150.1 retinol-binding protein pinta isoform X1 [Harpegnathos saltator]